MPAAAMPAPRTSANATQDAVMSSNGVMVWWPRDDDDSSRAGMHKRSTLVQHTYLYWQPAVFPASSSVRSLGLCWILFLLLPHRRVFAPVSRLETLKFISCQVKHNAVQLTQCLIQISLDDDLQTNESKLGICCTASTASTYTDFARHSYCET